MSDIDIDREHDDEYWDDERDDDACTWCGGEGYDECDDLIGCVKRHIAEDLCPCSACNGTGLASEQWIW